MINQQKQFVPITIVRISVKAATRFGMNPATCFG